MWSSPSNWCNCCSSEGSDLSLRAAVGGAVSPLLTSAPGRVNMSSAEIIPSSRYSKVSRLMSADAMAVLKMSMRARLWLFCSASICWLSLDDRSRSSLGEDSLADCALLSDCTMNFFPIFFVNTKEESLLDEPSSWS